MKMIKALYDCKKCENFKATNSMCDVCMRNCAYANIKYKENSEHTEIASCFNYREILTNGNNRS